MPKGVYPRKRRNAKPKPAAEGEHMAFPLVLLQQPQRAARTVKPVTRRVHREERMLLALALIQTVREIVNDN